MGTTPIYSIPYVEPSDAVADFPAAMRDQSNRIDWAIQQGNAFGWAKQTAVQAVANGVVTPIAPLALDANSRGVELSGTSLRVPWTGIYLVVGTVSFTHRDGGGRSAFIRRNGTSYFRSTGAVGTGTTPSVVTVLTYPFVAGDLIDFCAYQSSGSALNTDANQNGTSFSVTQL